MKLRMERYRIDLIPEGAADEAFIEEVLGLSIDGPGARVRRVNCMGLSSLAYVAIDKRPASASAGREEEG